MSTNQPIATFSSTFSESKNTDESLKYVQHRVVHGGITNDHIADFLKKYADIQQEFSKKIDRLVRQVHPSGADLGTFEESWTSFLQLVATQGLEACDLSDAINNDLESKVRNKKGRKEASEIFAGLKADSKTLSAHSYQTKAVSAMDKLQKIDQQRLTNLQESIGEISARIQVKNQKMVQLTDKLGENLTHFDAKTDIESYLAEVVTGDVVFPDMSPAASAGYNTQAPNRYASPALVGQSSHSIRPHASPLALNSQKETKESKLKKFFKSS